MKTARLVFALALLTAISSGCVTGLTLEEAKEQVYYKPCTPENPYRPPEVDHVEQAKPGLYALLPVTVAADVALLPVYVLGTVAINVGILPVP
ncbi:MAG: hypothetical protein ACLQU3_22875 [Limisphaerales bacterium]